MSELTDEQKLYINYDGIDDTKLEACAGSGKTKCIIARINNCIKSGLYKNNNIIMLTFSRFTRDDFIIKIKKYNAININVDYVKTIDSFAKMLIDPNNEIDVSLLSYRFMKYLENSPIEELMNNAKLSCIKSIYIDEAQDLNEIQFTIFKLMKQRLGTILNFVGDPNQNIYQFRKSSDKYFVEFEAKKFVLTHNFRSQRPIIEFSKYLRPSATTDIICAKEDDNENLKPCIVFHENDYEFETILLNIITEADNQNIDLSDIAILAPTRGKMRGYGKSHGLCLVSNILYKANIKFKQFYEEATDEISANSVAYMPEKGYINMLTYMGSKGLEWKYVIIVDADTCLINKRMFDEEKHNNDQYLLYVVCSRAINNMVIFSKYNNNVQSGKTYFNLNHWFSYIPKYLYQISDQFKEMFNFQPIKPYVGLMNNEKRVTKLIDKMNEETLDILANICGKYEKIITPIYKNKYSDLEQYASIFLGRYVENLFYAYYCIKHNITKKRYNDIENIINSKYIITDIPVSVVDWFTDNKNYLTWAYFDDKKSTIDKHIVDVIEKKFSRNHELSLHTIVNDGFYKSFILLKRGELNTIYDKYLSCTDSNKIKRYMFKMMVLLYALDTQHYFHVTNNGKKFKHILVHFDKLFDEMNNYIVKSPHKFIEHNLYVAKWDIHGEIDLLENINEKNIIWEVKCTTEITLKHILQVLAYNLIYHDINDDATIQLNYFNLLRGEMIKINLNISSANLKTIIELFNKQKQ